MYLFGFKRCNGLITKIIYITLLTRVRQNETHSQIIKFALLFHDLLCAKYGRHQTIYILSRSWYSMAQKFKVQVAMTYCKVASCRPVYYSIFEHFWDATNQDVLLFPCTAINQIECKVFVNEMKCRILFCKIHSKMELNPLMKHSYFNTYLLPTGCY